MTCKAIRWWVRSSTHHTTLTFVFQRFGESSAHVTRREVVQVCPSVNFVMGFLRTKLPTLERFLIPKLCPLLMPELHTVNSLTVSHERQSSIMISQSSDLKNARYDGDDCEVTADAATTSFHNHLTPLVIRSKTPRPDHPDSAPSNVESQAMRPDLEAPVPSESLTESSKKADIPSAAFDRGHRCPPRRQFPFVPPLRPLRPICPGYLLPSACPEC